jgi:hypothetical protein
MKKRQFLEIAVCLGFKDITFSILMDYKVFFNGLDKVFNGCPLRHYIG